MVELRLRTATVACPCCGYPTLHERAGYDICLLCWWEDDGQSDVDADEVRDGPNGDLCLSAARLNFRDHLTMYDRGKDTRVGGGDSEIEVQAKRTLMATFARLKKTPEDPSLWTVVDTQEHLLRSETERKLRDAGYLKADVRGHLPNER